jgi:hypothetical protein
MALEVLQPNLKKKFIPILLVHFLWILYNLFNFYFILLIFSLLIILSESFFFDMILSESCSNHSISNLLIMGVDILMTY